MGKHIKITIGRFSLLGCWLFFAGALSAQQDPLLTNYMFNRLAFNPAAAGSNEHLAATLLHRQQWSGVDGAPVAQAFNVHTPIGNGRIGLGLALGNDRIGATGATDMALSYAYRVSLGKGAKLSVGLQAGAVNWRSDWSKLTLEQTNDAAFANNLNRWQPNVGAGLLVIGPRFFAGFSCPRLLEYDLRPTDVGVDYTGARASRHYYATAGMALPLAGKQLVLRPLLLVKGVGWFGEPAASPTQIDFDLSLFVYETFWFGLGYRFEPDFQTANDDTADLWAAYCLRNGLRIGLAADIGFSAVQQLGGGAVEVLLGYEFDIRKKKVASPRYF